MDELPGAGSSDEVKTNVKGSGRGRPLYTGTDYGSELLSSSLCTMPDRADRHALALHAIQDDVGRVSDYQFPDSGLGSDSAQVGMTS